MALPPQRGPGCCPCVEVEYGADGADMAVDVQLVPMLVGPLLLLGCRHAYPQQIGIGVVDGINDGVAVGLGEMGLEGWGIGDDLKVRVVEGRAFTSTGKHRL